MEKITAKLTIHDGQSSKQIFFTACRNYCADTCISDLQTQRATQSPTDGGKERSDTTPLTLTGILVLKSSELERI
jgi:hypothetical protein